MGRGRAVILGGAGFIGSVTTQRMLEAGWDVTVIGLGSEVAHDRMRALGARVASFDRADTEALLRLVGDGVDAFVDVIPYRSEHARQLLPLRGRVGSLVVLSSAAVYVDATGRQLMATYSPEDGRTEHEVVRVREDQPRMAPDDRTYAGGKAAVEEVLRREPPAPVTFVRAFAVFGPGDKGSREWWVMKRVRDGRRFACLAQRGSERFNRLSVLNLGEIIRLAAERPATRAVNAADEDPFTVLDTVRQIARRLDWEFDEVLLPGAPTEPGLATTPWSGPVSMVADMTLAEEELGYRPLVTPLQTLDQTLEWLNGYMPPDADWARLLPVFWQRYGELAFDYETENRHLESLARGARLPTEV